MNTCVIPIWFISLYRGVWTYNVDGDLGPGTWKQTFVEFMVNNTHLFYDDGHLWPDLMISSFCRYNIAWFVHSGGYSIWLYQGPYPYSFPCAQRLNTDILFHLQVSVFVTRTCFVGRMLNFFRCRVILTSLRQLVEMM